MASAAGGVATALPMASVAASAVSGASVVLVAARFDADYLHNSKPVYPLLARRMGEHGRVLMRVLVSAQGTVDAVEIRTSSGSRRLDGAAQEAVRSWRFQPARRGEVPLESWVLVPVVFNLESG